MRFVQLALLLAPLAPVFAQESDPVPSLAEAMQFQNTQRYGDAIDAFETIVANDPSNAAAWFNLGYSLHMIGELDEALEAHLKAASFEGTNTRAIAYYNAACVHALRGRVDQAFDLIGKSRAAGFNNLQQVAGDSDLAALRSDPRWNELIVALGGQPMGGMDPAVEPLAGERALDFLVGTWNVLSGGNLVEAVTVERVLNDQALRMSAPSNESLLAWVPGADEWRWTWVSTRGHHDLLTGGARDGRIVMDQPILRDRPGAVGQCLLQNVTEGSFELVWNVSGDGGESWSTEAQQRWVRQGARPRAVPASFVRDSALEGARHFAPQIGRWDVSAKRMNADQSKTDGVGTALVEWCEDGQHLHHDIDVHFADWSAVRGTTFREWNEEAQRWDVTWEPEGGASATFVGVTKNGDYVEIAEGSDPNGEYSDTGRFDFGEDTWSVTIDRQYENGPKIAGIWQVAATRIR